MTINEIAEKARKEKLKDESLKLLDWLVTRIYGKHDTQTTISMLEQKVIELKFRVNRTGWDRIVFLDVVKK